MRQCSGMSPELRTAPASSDFGNQTRHEVARGRDEIEIRGRGGLAIVIDVHVRREIPRQPELDHALPAKTPALFYVRNPGDW